MLDELQGLELKEREARRQIGIAFPTRTRRHHRSPVARVAVDASRQRSAALVPGRTLGDLRGGVRRRLVAHRVTKERQTVHRLPDRDRARARWFRSSAGLIARADGLDGPVGGATLRPAAGRWPCVSFRPDIDRLIIIPDGPLHHLPFDALKGGPRRPGARERGTSWSSSRRPRCGDTGVRKRARTATRTGRSRSRIRCSMLVGTTGDAPRNETRRSSAACAWAAFPMRGARAGRSNSTSASVDVLVGSRASEKALKERDLRHYDILHFAVHAIADEAHPERSAVLLAPGAASEDGLLQSREIEGLDLEGRIVVLSACQTASGAIVSGEGVLSLARAFFESRRGRRHWKPLADSRRRRGVALRCVLSAPRRRRLTVGSAETGQGCQAIAANRPAAAWASLVLLGDGDFRPFPGGRLPAPPRTRSPGAAVALLALPLAVVIWLATRRHRPR